MKEIWKQISRATMLYTEVTARAKVLKQEGAWL